MEWHNPKKHVFRDGDFYLGRANNTDIGVTSERHAITIAGAGSGKGATCIIPNIKRWSHNLLVIDPKGENAKATVKDRAKRGQSVYVVDPFKRSGVDEKYIAYFNPLETLDINAMTIAEDIKAIADGIVMRGHDPSSDNWDDGAVTLIAGVIAFVLLEGDNKNLGEVRDIISEKELIEGFAKASKSDDRLGGLLKAGAGRVLAKEGEYYISNADKNTAWLDSSPIKECLSKSSFSLSELKNGKASVYLCLPANYVASHGRFLRMFVRCAIEEMARPTPSGKDKGNQCLFMLDEFFALGYINEISVSSGLMRGYGLQLWPILQDLGQLVNLYGSEGAQTFFANADVHQFFGVSDIYTADHVSRMLGVVGMDELPEPPKMPHMSQASSGMNLGGIVSGLAHGNQSKSGISMMGLTGGLLSIGSGLKSSAINSENQYKQEKYQNEMNDYQRAISIAGKPRVAPDEVMALTQKNKGIVAEHSINIVKGAQALLLTPQPYFSKSGAGQSHKNNWDYLIFALLFFMGFISNFNETSFIGALGTGVLYLVVVGFIYGVLKDAIQPIIASNKWIVRGLKLLLIWVVLSVVVDLLFQQDIFDVLGF